MTASVDMFVSALLGGAGIKVVEIIVSAWQARATANRAETTDKQALDAKIRDELRKDNETLRANLKEETAQHEALREKLASTEKHTVVVDPGVPVSRAEFAALQGEWSALRAENEQLRFTVGTLLQNNAAFMERITTLLEENEKLKNKRQR